MCVCVCVYVHVCFKLYYSIGNLWYDSERVFNDCIAYVSSLRMLVTGLPVSSDTLNIMACVCVCGGGVYIVISGYKKIYLNKWLMISC